MKANTWKCQVTVALVVTLLGTACQTDADRTRAQGAAIGTAVGAGTGAGIGAVVGGGEGAAIGAGAGAVLGGITGFLWGDHIAKKKKKFADDEAFLQACHKDAAAKRTQFQAYNAQMEKSLAELDAQTTQVAAAGGTKKRLWSKKLDEYLESVEVTETTIKKEIEMQEFALKQTDGKTPTAKHLVGEIGALQVERTRLQTELTQLTALNSRLK